MSTYKWRVYYDTHERVCYQVEGKNANVITLNEKQYLVIVDKTRDIISCSRDEALKTAIDLLDKA